MKRNKNFKLLEIVNNQEKVCKIETSCFRLRYNCFSKLKLPKKTHVFQVLKELFNNLTTTLWTFITVVDLTFMMLKQTQNNPDFDLQKNVQPKNYY